MEILSIDATLHWNSTGSNRVRLDQVNTGKIPRGRTRSIVKSHRLAVPVTSSRKPPTPAVSIFKVKSQCRPGAAARRPGHHHGFRVWRPFLVYSGHVVLSHVP